ncbi:MAG TPA: hypothetical protein VKA25_11980 [Gemmatimonadales bacterium]|nr:hypothetical protein [Gemmatimonadales bacterium]
MTAVAANNDYPPASAESHRTTVLVVEDQENPRTLIGRTLQSQGYGVLEAANRAEALLILEATVRYTLLSQTSACLSWMAVSSGQFSADFTPPFPWWSCLDSPRN